MATADTAKLIASLELKDRLSPGIKSATGSLGKLESRAYKVGRNIGTGIANAGKIAAVGFAALASQVAIGLDSLVDLEQQEAQTGAVLKSTGQAAGVNGAQVTKLAEKYENLNATIGDEFIRAGENMLLTFTQIRGKAFEPALAAVLDMNTAMGKGPEGLTKTAILVGKALNDPTKGLTALTRVGVTFTKGQVKQIKALQESGDLLGAQRVVLKELNKEFGGSFIAQGATTGGKVAKFKDAISDLQRTLAAGFLPVVSKVADGLSTFLADPAIIANVSKLGDKLASLFSDQNLNTGANVLRGLFQTAKDVAPAIASAAKVTGEVVRTAVQMFTSLPKELQTLLVGGLAVNKLTGGLVTNLAGGLISSVLKQLVSGVVNVQGASVIVTGPQAGLPGAVGAAGAAKPSAMGAVGKVVSGAVIIGGLSLSAESIAEFAAANAAAAEKGLNPAETAAIRYYNASTADQQTIAKRLGYVPTKADFQSGTAKLQGSVDRTTTRVEGMRGLLGAKLDRVSSNTIAAGVAAKNAGVEVKGATRVAGITAALAAQRAGVVAKSGGTAAASAIRRKRLSTSVTVNTRNVVNLSGREWLAQATVTNIRGGAS